MRKNIKKILNKLCDENYFSVKQELTNDKSYLFTAKKR